MLRLGEVFMKMFDVIIIGCICYWSGIVAGSNLTLLLPTNPDYSESFFKVGLSTSIAVAVVIFAIISDN